MDELMELAEKEISATPLTAATLDKLPAGMARPLYDRRMLSPGIVHIGVGNFHRAHLAWYVHRLMQQGGATDWAIIGAGVRENDRIMREKLLDQDCLTTLIELDPDGRQATEIIGSMIDYLPVEDDNQSLITAMADPRIRIVSLTITEGGYFLDPETGGLDVAHPDIRHDAENLDRPRTAFGAMVAALRIRHANGIAPFSGLCCDNLLGNGEILRQSVVGLARLFDPELASWIDKDGAFPNSMVDCIVPATGSHERELARRIGVDDTVPVTHENFRQWVVEDNFCAGRLDWEQAGAEFSDRVHEYEAQKIRMLNGGHQLLANVGEVMGINTISGAMANPLIHAFFRKVQTEEITPHVPHLPAMSVASYLDMIARRFANPAIVDTTRRVAFDGSARHVVFILPSIRDGLEAGMDVTGLALVEAIWARMCAGTREDGSHIEPNDPMWDMLKDTAMNARNTPLCWLQMTPIYGDLAANKRFADAFAAWLASLYRNGVEATIRHYVDQTTPA